MLFVILLQANCAVCKADNSGVTALSSLASCKDLYGTHCIGFYGKIRSSKSVSFLFFVLFSKLMACKYSHMFPMFGMEWRNIFLFNFLQVAVLQMLEKQMGPESFRKVSFLSIWYCFFFNFFVLAVEKIY